MSDTALTTTTHETTSETDPAPTFDEVSPPTPIDPSPPTNGLLLDGEAPRLGSTPLVAPGPLGTELAAPVTATPTESDAPRFAENAPDIAAADMPTLPTADPAASTAPVSTEDAAIATNDAGETDADDHPMAHLMPAKAKPTEASRRAVELRAEKQAKAKKIKIGVAIGAVVFTAVVGPPLWSWLSNAVNEAGGITNEQPDG